MGLPIGLNPETVLQPQLTPIRNDTLLERRDRALIPDELHERTTELFR